MRVFVGWIALLTATGLFCFGKDETTEQLIARAEAAPVQQQSDLFSGVAERELKSAIEAFKSGNSEEGRSALGEIVKYSDKAHSASIKANKKQKRIEIRLRRISVRLRDMKLNVDVDDQAQVQATVDKLEQFRTELLKSMFGPKNND